MEDITQEIKRECSDDNLWYKLYADDLVLVIPKNNLKNLIESLYSVSILFNLTINAKKSAIFAMKGH
jgi:hypothetical protein